MFLKERGRERKRAIPIIIAVSEWSIVIMLELVDHLYFEVEEIFLKWEHEVGERLAVIPKFSTIQFFCNLPLTYVETDIICHCSYIATKLKDKLWLKFARLYIYVN